MLSTEDTNVVEEALSRLMEQYQGLNLMQGLITALAQGFQTLESAIFSLDAGRQLWNGTETPAVGAQLDGIGEIVGIPRNGLSDMEYILFLFGKIAENYSDTTTETILTIVGYLFNTTNVQIQDIYPAGVYISVLDPQLPSDLIQTAKGLVQNALGAGIKLVLSLSPVAATFRYAGPGVGVSNGYGDANSPDSGGVYAGVV